MEFHTAITIAIVILLLVLGITIFSFRSPDTTVPIDNTVRVTSSVASVKTLEQTGVYQYYVNLNANVEYTGTLKEDIQIMPLLTFGGISRKVKVNSGNSNMLVIEKSTGQTSFEIEQESVTLRIPPIINVHDQIYQGKLKEKESIILTSSTGGIVFVGLDEMKETSFFSSVANEALGAESLRCVSRFRIECKEELKIEELADCSLCEGDECSLCKKAVSLCGSTFEITTREMDCGSREIGDVNAIVYGGEKEFSVGYEMLLSFWKISECTELYDRLEDLTLHCTDDHLGTSKIVASPK